MRSRCRTDAAVLLGLLLAAAPAAAQAPVDIAMCRYLSRHTPSAGVEYKPGTDVRGNRVAPADLPGSPGATALDRFDVPLTLDFARRLGAATPNTSGLPKDAVIANLTVRDGRVFINGQPLNAASEAELVALCRTVR